MLPQFLRDVCPSTQQLLLLFVCESVSTQYIWRNGMTCTCDDAFLFIFRCDTLSTACATKKPQRILHARCSFLQLTLFPTLQHPRDIFYCHFTRSNQTFFFLANFQTNKLSCSTLCPFSSAENTQQELILQPYIALVVLHGIPQNKVRSCRFSQRQNVNLMPRHILLLSF